MMSVVSTFRDLNRLREISQVLARHGFGEIVTRAGFGRTKKTSDAPPASGDAPIITREDQEAGETEKKKVSTGQRIRLAIQDLGPSFIKLGQIASTRQDVIPADVIAELKKLQDDVPALPFSEIKQQIESSLGASIDDIYKSFDEKPLATASIGQVHRAVLATDDGDMQVVVKVQRPNVAQTVARDVELLHTMAAALERAMPETKIYSPVGLVQQFDRSITAELDFTTEAENAIRFARNFDGSAVVRFPKVYKQASSKHVLTLEFFDGMKIEPAVRAGWDGKQVAKNAVGIVIKMIFEDGFFHADPHPGNIILIGTKAEPVLGMIDVGMVGRLSPELRDRTIDLMIAAVRKDSYGVADALYAVGTPQEKVDMKAYRAEAAMLAEKYLGKPLKEIELSAMIRDLAQGAMKYKIEIPPDFMMVGKALMTLEGIGKQLDPDLDVFGEASPYFFDLLKKRYSPERLGNELWRGVEQLTRVGYDMPMQVREVLEDLRLGRLSVRAPDPDRLRATDRLGRRIFSGLVVASMVLGGALCVRAQEPVLGIGMLVVAGVLLLGHVVLDSRR